MIIDRPKRNEWSQLVKRPELDQRDLTEVISDIFDAVKDKGDIALKKFTLKFDGVEIENVKAEESTEDISEQLKDAIDVASANIHKFHESQALPPNMVETSPGVVCWQESRAIEKVGLYIPGGTAPLFSTVLMLAIPAKIAGCREIVLCTPPDPQGKIHPAISYAAKVSGITEVFALGGSQAIAAMAVGTESIPKVQKIFGPGNQYVTAAKKHAQSLGTAIDMPAGPSELLVIASENSIPKYVASDLLSQAEHGADSQVICLSLSKAKLEQILAEVEKQLQYLPRSSFARQAIQNSKFLVLNSFDELVDFTNLYAPEHLIIADEDFDKYISYIESAGSVFLGNYCPESAGDYASGTNHTLPTAGFARNYSGVNLDAFVKKITFQKINKSGILHLGPTIEIMAEAEGLEGHKNAVTIRLNDLKRDL
ncbi:histidinol dehydrogenase [Portibacter marinus]|uniref:histidinol dehydrogenase n=1 Tax=Portibacter marinus TaxID=2898660 RepID=UPI001F37F462|nr:histidinol dehydrogenase [Portibacter marinus]